jgi:hypothetical protein
MGTAMEKSRGDYIILALIIAFLFFAVHSINKSNEKTRAIRYNVSQGTNTWKNVRCKHNSSLRRTTVYTDDGSSIHVYGDRVIEKVKQ